MPLTVEQATKHDDNCDRAAAAAAADDDNDDEMVMEL